MIVKILGIIVIICIFILVWMCAHYTASMKGNKVVWAGTATTVCGTVSIMLVLMYLLCIGERETNIREQSYQEGINQKWQQRIDTIWIPKK
jgi:Na+-driven multidrug efflux pump